MLQDDLSTLAHKVNGLRGSLVEVERRSTGAKTAVTEIRDRVLTVFTVLALGAQCRSCEDMMQVHCL